jgi:4-alpha-glucanotransferase
MKSNLHKSILSHRRAGISFPLLSTASEKSFESGDFYALKRMGDFAKKSGFSILQILPLNDTGYGQSPYSAITVMGIDPIYISLFELGIHQFSRKSKIESTKIHHNRIKAKKLEILKKHYESNAKELDQNSKDFYESNPWLKEYVCFKILYELNNGNEYTSWNLPTHHSKEDLIEVVYQQNLSEWNFHVFLQKIAFDQLKETKKYLTELGIFLKGDMPILLSLNSADVFFHPELFDTNLSAGAPPDPFSDDGQNWGFPLFNWEKMKEDKYVWLKTRIQYLENFFHLYRIDHVIGMYRIWTIPRSVKSAKKGWFEPQIGVSKQEFFDRLLDPKKYIDTGIISEFRPGKYIFHWDFYLEPAFQDFNEDERIHLMYLSNLHREEEERSWRKKGEEVLNFLDENTMMLPCAEDLGSVPEFIRDSIHQRQLIGIDINRWTMDENGWMETDKYRQNAVSALSTHDTPISLDWFDSLSEENKKRVSHSLKLDTSSPETILESMLKFSFSTRSIFSIQLLHDILITHDTIISHSFPSHRINLPGSPEEKNWKYRYMHTTEDLINHEELNKKLRSILIETTRV